MDYPTPPLVIYIDVDDTFVRTYGAKRIPIPAVLSHIRMLHAQGGVEMYCWSSGGAAYARGSAEEFGVADCFTAFLPKPQVMIDDQDVSEWRQLLQAHPAGDVMATAEDYRARLASR
ncbi:hypothetical protein CCAX7_53680 [Capsulimonas corticalis]|uniref:Uncharacterized protein n=1 Tax=Capsulimonas corticalis TaxID=2219043 RepID=A0A402CNK9_9BACT|nr:hypothetical protein [Capsulimonas corticalis]BDI33317.1 hypothetical protein CCAX7_53680 [Capsulimonas corticalis]